MGLACAKSSEDQQKALKKDTEIDRFLRKRTKAASSELKLLLLGPGESGKSTVYKQVKMIQAGGGFTENELRSFRGVVYSNVITQMKVLLSALHKLPDLPPLLPSNLERGEKIALMQSAGFEFTSDLAEDIKCLWLDPAIQSAYSFRDLFFQLNDSSSYFFNEMERIGKKEYVPTNDDILRVRTKTSGIDECDFVVDDLDFRLVDVGGQRSERRKWIHCFDNVTVVIFCVAMSEYNQQLREDHTQNRMVESLLLFSELLSSPWFSSIPFILLLNKSDLFLEKIGKVPLRECESFREYEGANNMEEAGEYMKSKFIAENRNPSRRVFALFFLRHLTLLLLHLRYHPPTHPS